MKTILIISLIFCASQAFLLNSTAYFYGFSDQLNLTSPQIQQGLSCVTGIHTLISDIQNLISLKNQGIEQLFFATAKLIGDIKYGGAGECESYHDDIMNYISQASNAEDIKDVVKGNIERFAPEIIQQISIWSNEFSTGEDYQAGQTHGYLLQILLGVEQPQELTVPTVNASLIVPFNAEQFTTQFYQTVFNVFGFTNQTAIDLFIGCGMNINTFTQAVIALRREMEQAGSLEEKMLLAATGAEAVFELVEQCSDIWGTEKMLLAPLFERFKDAPIQTLLIMMNNVASSLPQMIRQQKAEIVAILEGEYTLAGEIAAQQEMTVLQGVISFPLSEDSQ